MRTPFLIAIFLYTCSAQYDLPTYLPKVKRETAGALDILTNDAHPIHTDIKPDKPGIGQVMPKYFVPASSSTAIPGARTSRKLARYSLPHQPDSSTAVPGYKAGQHRLSRDQVVPPRYEPRSLRKSLPVNTGLDIIRGVSRVVMLVTLVVVAVVEVYPIVFSLYENVYDYFVVA